MKVKSFLGPLITAGLTLSVSAAGADNKGDEAQQAQLQINGVFRLSNDLPRAESTIKEALATLDRLAPNDRRRFQGHWSALMFFRSSGQHTLAAGEEVHCNNILTEAEKVPELSTKDIVWIASDLNRLADLHAPCRVDIRLLQPTSVSQAEMKAAEGLRLRALALTDRLPAGDLSRIEGHRWLFAWYKGYGLDAKASEQTAQLVKLMGTDDPAKLFPKPPPCPACGMG